MSLSIVTTLYRSAATIDEFHRRAVAAGEAISPDLEIIMVDDGSPDDSLDRALAIAASDPRVVVVELSRNFGHHKALMTGLAHARGDLVLLIDSDLEEAPELLGELHAAMMARGDDVVFGVQRSRRGGWLERVTGDLFYRAVDALSDHPMPRNVVTARLMRQDYVQALVAHQDHEFVIAHLWSLAGFRQSPLPIDKLSLSPTTYNFSRRVQMAIKYLTTTSTRLLYIILYFGAAICTLSFVTLIYFTMRYLIYGVLVEGWVSLFVSVWFFGGVSTLIMGIIGIYIANILAETKRRPYTVARRVHRSKAPDVAPDIR